MAYGIASFGKKNGTSIAVEDEFKSGEWQASSVQAVTPNRFPLQMFSQGQIAELAGDDQTALLREIDRAAGIEELRGRLIEGIAVFYSTKARIREIDSRLSELEDPTTIRLQDVERKLARFEEVGHTTILRDYRHSHRQREELDRQFEAVEESAKRIEVTAEALQLQDLPDDLFEQISEEDREVVDLVTSLRTAVETADQQLRMAAESLRRVVESQRETSRTGKWQCYVEKAGEAYRNLVKHLEIEGVTDPNEYESLVQEKQRLDSEIKSLQSDKEERDKLVRESKNHLQEVQKARQAMTIARRDFLSKTLSQNNFVHIEIQPYGDDPRTIERSLRRTLNVLDDRFSDDIFVANTEYTSKGIVANLIKDLPEELYVRMPEVDNRLANVKQRFELACSGQGDFGGHLNNYLEREFGRTPELLDNLWTWFPEDGLSVKYSPTGDGKGFRPISQASAGQRAAAMLAFLLAHGDEPLILDQPEDDLDNHLIYDLVVHQIRENKLRRQIIVVTHNPNIVVNGDAEMLHALAFDRGQCVVRQSGSLQEEVIRDEVCQVMEGGREAFRRRYRRLG